MEYQLITPYLRKVEISKKRKAKYHKKGKSLKQLPAKYKVPFNVNGSLWHYNKLGFAIDNITKQKIICNPIAAGTPKYWTISGNRLYDGSLSHFQRCKVTKIMHDFFRNYVKLLAPIIFTEGGYITIELEIHCPIGLANWDISNKWPYIKWFEDTLTEVGIIPDDNIKYIRSSGKMTFVEDNQEYLKFIIKQF